MRTGTLPDWDDGGESSCLDDRGWVCAGTRNLATVGRGAKPRMGEGQRFTGAADLAEGAE